MAGLALLERQLGPTSLQGHIGMDTKGYRGTRCTESGEGAEGEEGKARVV